MGANDGIELHRASSRGYTIAYEDNGAGPAVVLVPGFLQCATDWRDWGYIARLAPTHRVLAMDPLGHGRSDKPHEWEAYRIPDVAADIVAVLDAAGVERAAVWGYSRGAAMAAVTAIEFPSRVEALIAGGAWLGVTPELGGSFARPMVAPLSAGDWPRFWATFGIEVPPEVRGHFEVNDPQAMSAVAAAGCESDYTADVSRIAAPTLLYCGANDPFAPGMRMDAQALGIEVNFLAGQEHLGGFRSVDDVVPLVLKHLQESQRGA